MAQRMKGGITREAQMQPTPDPGITDEHIRKIAGTLGALVMGAVGGLWAGLSALSETT